MTTPDDELLFKNGELSEPLCVLQVASAHANAGDLSFDEWVKIAHRVMDLIEAKYKTQAAGQLRTIEDNRQKGEQ